MQTNPPKSPTITIRLPERLLNAINAARTWARTGHSSRNAWITAVLEAEVDMRTVPTAARYNRALRRQKTARGRI